MICPPDHKHGEKTTCYSRHGCRCVDCRARRAVYSGMSGRKRYLVCQYNGQQFVGTPDRDNTYPVVCPDCRSLYGMEWTRGWGRVPA